MEILDSLRRFRVEHFGGYAQDLFSSLGLGSKVTSRPGKRLIVIGRSEGLESRKTLGWFLLNPEREPYTNQPGNSFRGALTHVEPSEFRVFNRIKPGEEQGKVTTTEVPERQLRIVALNVST